MRFLIPASSILLASCLLLLAGCESIGIPNHFARHDEVPPEVKATPTVLDAPPLPSDTLPWPRLGDVPFMPKDFSPPPVYNHYMNEMEFQRDDAVVAKEKAQQTDTQLMPSVGVAPAANTGLLPPQLPQRE